MIKLSKFSPALLLLHCAIVAKYGSYYQDWWIKPRRTRGRVYHSGRAINIAQRRSNRE